ncbi:MAG: hypothetical protein ACOCZ7_00345 [Armatimonadota bacterium]
MAAATAICLGVAVALLFWDPLIALGFVGGVITGAGTLGVLVVVLNRVVVPRDERKGRPAPWVALHIAKFAAAAALAYVVVEMLDGDIIAFAGGYTVALIVLLVTMAGEPTTVASLTPAAEDGSEADNDDPAR